MYCLEWNTLVFSRKTDTGGRNEKKKKGNKLSNSRSLQQKEEQLNQIL